MNIIIVHGSFGSPDENWFPWLRLELEKLGHAVFVPGFPTPAGQSLESWLSVFEGFRQHLDSETVFVGHSLGPAFILSVLEGLEKPVKAAFFVAGFVGSLGNERFDEINRTFAEREFDWERIRRGCRQFFVLYSDNDPYVPQDKARELASRLRIEPVLVKGAGHFNERAGYSKFPLLLEKIKSLM